MNAVSSGLPQSSFLSVAQLSPFGKKLVALGNKIHHPLAFGISHRQGDQAGFRFQPAPVLGIPLSVGRIRRHGVLRPSHPGVERLSQVYVPNKGPASGTFCEGSPAPVEAAVRQAGSQDQGRLPYCGSAARWADHPSTSGQAKTQIFSVERAIGFAPTVSPLGLVCWLHKDALLAAINKEIDAHAHDDLAITPVAKEKALAEANQA